MESTPTGRRAFLALAAGAAGTWAAGAAAQSQGRVRRIALMLANAETDREGQARVAAFRRSLAGLGWEEGRNLHVEYRWGAGEAGRARAHAEELVGLEPEVILTQGTTALAAAHKATRRIPIVFLVVADPVGGGFVRTLARPDGNATGFSTFDPEIGGKWLELLREVAPGVRRAAGVLDPAFRGFAGLWRAIEETAPGFGMQTASVVFHQPTDDIDAAIGSFAREPGGGLIVMPTSINTLHRDRILASAARHRLPAVYPFSHYVADGGLLSYGVDIVDLFRRSADYVDRILEGEPPASLPVQAPTKFELVVNLKTAKALGLAVPPSIVARADQVIE